MGDSGTEPICRVGTAHHFRRGGGSPPRAARRRPLQAQASSLGPEKPEKPQFRYQNQIDKR
jgi:hypothetical protein